MPNLVFNRLVVASDTQRSANQFSFSPRFNLITANDNSFGKSTLAKLLFWTLGGDPDLDVTWQSFDVRALVDFSVGGQKFQAGRYGKTMFLKRPNAQWESFPKITGAYSKVFAEIVGFDALLPNRNDTTKLETPPPAFYFLPFYVDQQRSWTEAWHSFPHLEQYANWQRTVIQYHTGYLLPEFFSIEEQIAHRNLERKTAELEVRRIETAIDVVNAYVPATSKTVALTNSDFDALASEVNIDISELQSKQEELLRTIAESQTDRIYLQSQLNLARHASTNLEGDYSFSVERVNGETLLCPLCGTVHDNSSPNRASILADKDEADGQIHSLTGKINHLNGKLALNQGRLEETRDQIAFINNKYIASEAAGEAHELKGGDFSFLDGLASRAVQKHVQRSMETKTALIREIKKTNNALKTTQKKLLTKEEREEMDAHFKENLSKYVDALKARGINLSLVESPLDYKKLTGNGGAAESTRGISAYYMAILRQIYSAKNESFSAVVIDTPNQQEQADFNYEAILQFLMTTVPSDAQLILCAMNRKEIEAYKIAAHVIELNDEKILRKSEYEKCRPLLNFEPISSP